MMSALAFKSPDEGRRTKAFTVLLPGYCKNYYMAITFFLLVVNKYGMSCVERFDMCASPNKIARVQARTALYATKRRKKDVLGKTLATHSLHVHFAFHARHMGHGRMGCTATLYITHAYTTLQYSSSIATCWDRSTCNVTMSISMQPAYEIWMNTFEALMQP